MSDGTFTQEQIDASFKKGIEKGKAEAAEVKQSAETAEKLKRYEELEKAEKQRLQNAEINETIEKLKAEELATTGLKGAGIKRFAQENHEHLKGLSGEDLEVKVKTLKGKLDKDDQSLFFESGEVNVSKTLGQTGEPKKEEPSIEYYPGSSIKIQK